MIKEIGGYFEFEKLMHKEYYEDLVSLNNGRNALVYLIKSKGIKKIYLPFYLCDSVSNVCIREKCDFDYYHVDNNFIPIFNSTLKNDDYIYIVNYFGFLTNDQISSLKMKYGNIILDNVQSFFQKPIKGIDTIYSCRKFFGVPDGAYLSTDSKIQTNLSKDHSTKRMKHLLGRFDGEASQFYLDFKANDESFKHLPLMEMSSLTHNLLGAIDYLDVSRKRFENYNFLKSQLSNINLIKIDPSNVPFCYPLYLKNGSNLRKYLIDNKIYIPIYWPNVLMFDDDCKIEKEYCNNILPIPCDQRYNGDDMKRICHLIFEFLRNKSEV